MKEDTISRVMREMGKRGGKKGGPKGGKSRMNSLTPEERKELARKAANKRWENARAKKKQAPDKGTSVKKNSP
ncbi:MAG TPA: hypothetical protein VK638_08855 [Edaphobacter sp.]|nr:hypothetical protein [Edaphobacter sp.]